MRINCEILDLRVVLAILDLRSFQKASEALNLSQPALSRRLQALEVALGASLVDRTTRRVAPTRVGRELEPQLRRLVREFDDCVFCVGDFGVAPSGHITIAALPTTSSALLPRVIKEFNRIYPKIQLRICDVTRREGLECVARGEAEFGVNTSSASWPELSFTPLIDDEFVLACRNDHPLADSAKICWRDLIDEPLIISQKSDNRALIDQALSRSDVRLNWSFEVNHLATSFGLIEAGVGMSIIPRLSRPAEKHPSIAVVPIREPTVSRTVGIIERRGTQMSRAAAKLRDMLIAECSQL